MIKAILTGFVERGKRFFGSVSDKDIAFTDIPIITIPGFTKKLANSVRTYCYLIKQGNRKYIAGIEDLERPDLNEDEVAIHRSKDNYIKLKRDGEIEIVTKQGVQANFKSDGSVEVQGSKNIILKKNELTYFEITDDGKMVLKAGGTDLFTVLNSYMIEVSSAVIVPNPAIPGTFIFNTATTTLMAQKIADLAKVLRVG